MSFPTSLCKQLNFTRSAPILFPMEYRMWMGMWKQKDTNDFTCKLVDVLHDCSYSSFPNIHVLLQLALTLPITSCESERSSSQLKPIKTSHRSTMCAERLSGLALMKINCERCQQTARFSRYNKGTCEAICSSKSKENETSLCIGWLTFIISTIAPYSYYNYVPCSMLTIAR